jgi:YegS/Rv2252/BmrU family lipid kinase
VAKRGLIVHNPAARGAVAVERLREAAGAVPGWELTLEATTGPGHATELARGAAAAGLDAVVASGGDGTVNEVANGLAGSATALAVVRGGTANVWGKEARIPRKPAEALGLLADGEVRTIDLGRAGERYFLLMAGVGFDAAIVNELTHTAKKRLGAASYVVAGLRLALRYRAIEAQLSADAEALSTRLYWLMLGNTRNYGGVLNLAHMAKADDGRLELLLLQRGGVLRLGWLAFWALLKRHQRRAYVLHRSVISADVRTPGLPVQVDGEFLGETPMRFEVVPGTLRVIVPRGLKSPLFSR